ncbi:MFS transporter [Wenxinia saemankumensis]|uniref:Fucose permease n=1 Tax=Wenxinia saemankumensis TaxID=1447782 RepID=A0A1M6EMA1_9RHOB|nr:hypothetical protein [Wenxinia saemankumensis]SHI86370.1 Fucose permease [Wenxinia saemankumensis]
MSRPLPSNMRLLIAGSLGFILCGAINPLYGLAIPIYRAEWGAGWGGTLLAFHGAGALLAVAAGVFGLPHLTMRLSLGLLAAGSVITALGTGWPVVTLGAFVIGIGFGLTSAVVNRRFLSEFGERGPGMVGLVNSVFGVGAIAAPLILVGLGERLLPVYLGLAVMAAILIPVVQPSGRQARAQGLPDLRQKRLAILIFIHLAVITEVALFGLGPTSLLDMGLDSGAVAGLTSAFFGAFLAARLSLFWVTRRIRADQLFALGLGGAAVAMGIAAAGAPATGFILAGAAVGLQFPTFYVWASHILGPDPRMGSAVLTASISGAITGPALLAPVLAATGTGALFAILCGLMAATLAGFLLMSPWARRHALPA